MKQLNTLDHRYRFSPKRTDVFAPHLDGARSCTLHPLALSDTLQEKILSFVALLAVNHFARNFA
jgi:hypothetical protein